MIAFTFFKTRKPKQFEYRPRYYDPEAEERELRKKAILGENYRDNYKTESETSEEDYNPGQYVNEMRMRRGVIADRRRTTGKNVGLRMIIFLVLLILVGLWLYF